MAPTIKVGDTIPEATFTYIAYTPELEAKVCRVDTCCEDHPVDQNVSLLAVSVSSSRDRLNLIIMGVYHSHQA